MVKCHKKQSKRRTCRRKYKIKKKVAEHKRKVRREKKKNPVRRKPKDPGVPNSFPFKDEILHEAEQRKQRAKDLREAQRESRLKLQLENRGIEDLVAEVNLKEKSFQTSNNSREVVEEEAKSSSSKFKSFYKEFKQVVESADVILEVLDARDPLGSRCPQVEQLVINAGKRLVLVLNKIDLIPKNNLDEWLKYLRQELPTVAFKASNDNLSQSKVAAVHITESLLTSRRCVGASFLMNVLRNYCRNQNIQTFIKVGVVGFPNVGKSSVIYSLKYFRGCTVGATRGVTKTVQEVSLDKHIKILDSPGVVFAKEGSSVTLALRYAIKVETLKDVLSPAEAIVHRADHMQLCLHYCVPQFSSCHELLSSLARKMGRYKRGGIPNTEDGARRLINDWNNGKIKYYTHPPKEFKQSVHISAEYVTEMGKAFNLSEMEENMELDKAPALPLSQGVAVKPAEPTDGIVGEEEVEAMEDDSELAKAVEFISKKENNMSVVDDLMLANLMLAELRQKKQKFRKRKRKKKKLEKVASESCIIEKFHHLSESMDINKCILFGLLNNTLARFRALNEQWNQRIYNAATPREEGKAP